MLRVLGSPKRLCDGLTRRDMLHVGGLSLFGLGLESHLRASETTSTRPATFGKAKSCILLFLYGSPSQLEWADMKYDAPAEIRGQLGGIRSSLPGCDVCELYPHMSRIMDRMTVVRSMSHPYPLHGVAFATTGVPAIDVPMELNPRDGRHWPYIGSVVDYLERQRGRRRDVPNNIALPWPFSTRRAGEVPRAGPYAAFLGSAYNPIWTELHEQGTVRATKRLRDEEIEFLEPYMGITPESRFELATATERPANLTLDRLDRRRSLLEQFDAGRAAFDRSESAQSLDRYRAMAHDLIASPKVREALDLNRESRPMRETYGMNCFGQACVVARRLVEAGSRFITVFWDEYGLAGSGWDTHVNHYPRMKDELSPGLDRALFGLITDLEQRGLLDETLVCVMSEHGRTPRINRAHGGGRDHWSQAYTCMFAGGGVARGRVIGRTDRHGATVLERPVSPKEILATMYHLLGFDPETLLADRIGRPLPLVQGNVVHEILG
jgi:hypothetical protein